ncbi:SRPBCC domain-containing protein [Nonomuraea sp. NPDC050790]|uniref:SRPBCC domain-containing protein n=1 Tax=Nonomuraea sp. NPDC050790 TaxID=3364371 RepID=UPI0037B1402F
MGHEFEIDRRAEVPATPEEIWAAIATGPGIDSWFMGRNQVADGAVTTVFGDYSPTTRITAAEPGARFAHGTETAPDGRFVAYEFLIEAQAGGSTVLRAVTSGFLPGDDWQDEFEAMSGGLELFFATLVEYLTHFRGRTATPLTVFGPPVPDWDQAWQALAKKLGLPHPAAHGDRVRLAGEEGVVYLVNSQNLAVRTPTALYRFMRGFHGPMIASHHLFGPDPGVDWSTWLAL